jgi:hypothetical protein
MHLLGSRVNKGKKEGMPSLYAGLGLFLLLSRKPFDLKLRRTGCTGQEERTRKEVATLSRAKIVLAAAFVAALMMVAMAAPAFAFIHDVTPAGSCPNAAAGHNPGDNDAADEALEDPDRAGLIEEGESIQNPPAPNDCPAPQ